MSAGSSAVDAALSVATPFATTMRDTPESARTYRSPVVEKTTPEPYRALGVRVREYSDVPSGPVSVRVFPATDAVVAPLVAEPPSATNALAGGGGGVVLVGGSGGAAVVVTGGVVVGAGATVVVVVEVTGGAVVVDAGTGVVVPAAGVVDGAVAVVVGATRAAASGAVVVGVTVPGVTHVEIPFDPSEVTEIRRVRAGVDTNSPTRE